ncbi:MAG: phosphotransferase [Ornithinibacter sp.]
MAPRGRTRIGWAQLPVAVRAGVEEILGARVVSAASQPGGLSPGSADRLVTDDGGTAFVKAVSSAQNQDSPGIHRAEAAVCRQLPADLPAARFIGLYDDGDWVALVLEDVEGRHPATPWVTAELEASLQTLATIAERLTPSPVTGIATAAAALSSTLDGWARLAADTPSDLHPWAAEHLHDLVELSRQGVESLAGDTVVHMDVRADNLLLTPTGGVVLVDWPWACVGASWADTVALLVNVNLHGGHDVDELVSRYAVGAGRAQVDGFLAGLAGFFLDGARLPDPPGLPTLRGFQRVQGNATLEWLARRLDWGSTPVRRG